jgi:phage/plasmid-like protein (TIGR03299 family)
MTITASNITPVRTSPWTRLGSPIDVRPDCTDRDILARAGLDWRVGLRGIYTDAFNPIPDYRAVVREDTGRALGVVSPEYHPLQNDQILGLLRCLSGQVPLTIETAGSFRFGALTWMQARLDGLEIRVGDDVTHSYLLASTGHDGNRPFVLGLQGIRVICQNTLALAIREVHHNRSSTGLARGHVIRHTKGMPVAIQDALDTYRTALDAQKTTQAAYHHLASVTRSRAMERKYLDLIFPGSTAAGADEHDRATAIRKAREERIQAILASPTSLVRGTAGSLFSLMQAVVEYVDFARPTRTSEGESADAARTFSASFGSGADLKSKAWDTALALAA